MSRKKISWKAFNWQILFIEVSLGMVWEKYHNTGLTFRAGLLLFKDICTIQQQVYQLLYYT